MIKDNSLSSNLTNIYNQRTKQLIASELRKTADSKLFGMLALFVNFVNEQLSLEQTIKKHWSNFIKRYEDYQRDYYSLDQLTTFIIAILGTIQTSHPELTNSIMGIIKKLSYLYERTKVPTSKSLVRYSQYMVRRKIFEGLLYILSEPFYNKLTQQFEVSPSLSFDKKGFIKLLDYGLDTINSIMKGFDAEHIKDLLRKEFVRVKGNKYI